MWSFVSLENNERIFVQVYQVNALFIWLLAVAQFSWYWIHFKEVVLYLKKFSNSFKPILGFTFIWFAFRISLSIEMVLFIRSSLFLHTSEIRGTEMVECVSGLFNWEGFFRYLHSSEALKSYVFKDFMIRLTA